MAFKPNYNQQRRDRQRAKDQKKQEKLQKKQEAVEKRKADRGDDFDPDGNPETTST
jgi:hypothetical protein